MTFSPISDAAQFFRLRRDGSKLQAEMRDLTVELSSGRHADIGRALGGDYTALSDVTRRLELARGYAEAISVAALRAQAQQTVLERLENEMSGLAAQLNGFRESGNLSQLALGNSDVGGRFDHAVAALNTRIADISLFSGDRTDQLPLISGEAILQALRPIARAAPDAETMVQDIEAWFLDTGGGFELTAWQGGDPGGARMSLSEGTQIDTTVTAFDPRVRAALAGLSLAVLAAEGLAPGGEQGVRQVTGSAAERIHSAEVNLITVQAELGVIEGRIEDTRVRSEATKAGLEIEYTRLSETDPYRTATELEAVQTRLESLYIVTSRLSRLSLTEYLR